MSPMPWMFYFEHAEEAESVARELFELGAVVIADPSHLPDHLLDHLVSVSRVDDGEVRATIHEVDWTVTISWEWSDPEYTARDLLCLVQSPGNMFDSLDVLPEGTPERVIKWLELDEGDDK